MTQELRLPSKEEMQKQTEEDLSMRKSMGLSEKYSHKMTPKLLFDYSDKLSKMADIQGFSPVFRHLYMDLEVIRKKNLTTYKDLKFKIISREKYVIHENNGSQH